MDSLASCIIRVEESSGKCVTSRIFFFFFSADRKSSSGTGYDGGTVNSVTGEGGQRRTGKTNTQTKNHWGVKQRPGVQDPGVDCREKKEGK